MRFPPMLACWFVVAFALVLVAAPEGAWAQEGPGAVEFDRDPGPTDLHLTRDLGRPLMLSIVFTIIGVALFAASIWVMVKFAPFPVIKEIEEDQNVALAIIMAAVILGLAMILSAAMLG